MTRERQIEDLLFYHPYLIHPELERLFACRQKRKGQERPDLLFELEDGLCIVELKKTSLTCADLSQLLRYCRAWSEMDNKALSRHHYLIGKRPADESRLLRAVAQSEFEIRLRYLGEHLPLKLAWDAKARRYNPLDDNYSTMDYLELRL